jgi:hypothetical protein
MKTFLLSTLALSTFFAFAACSGGGGTVGGPSSSSSSSGSPGGKDVTPDETPGPGDPQRPNPGDPGKPSGATNVSCKTADDCGNWFCYCKDSAGNATTPVNARNCNNGWCMDAQTVCPGACSRFGDTWTGQAGNGPDK